MLALVAAAAGCGSPCGDCPKDYACGRANGVAVCRAPSGVPQASTVFVIMMENTSYATLHDDDPTNTPWLHGLFTSAAYATDYHGVTHPSLPNYLALTSGTPGVQADGSPVSCDCAPQGSTCMACNVLSSCACEQTSTAHLGDAVEAAGKTWRAYGESMGTPCNLTAAGDYVPRHVPFLYYQDVQEDAARCQSHVVDYAALAGDLGGQTPSLVFIAPNLADDMHGTSAIPNPFNHAAEMKAGDQWLAANVPAITASKAFAKGMLFIVWDEDDLSGGLTGTDDPIPLFALSPLAKNGGYVLAAHANHYDLLATIDDALALPRTGTGTPLSDLFPAM